MDDTEFDLWRVIFLSTLEGAASQSVSAEAVIRQADTIATKALELILKRAEEAGR